MKRKQRIEKALQLIDCYGDIDGGHHKQWVLDQVVRALTDCPVRVITGTDYNGINFCYDGPGKSAEYEQWIKSHADGEDGPNTYDWDEGIAP